MSGERIRLARKRAGYSLRELADRLGSQRVTPQALGKYERGEMAPSSNVRGALAKALRVDVSFFEAQSAIRLGRIDFRKHFGTTVQERSFVEAAILQQVERYLFVENVLGLDSAFWQVPCRSSLPSRLTCLEDAEQMADCARDAWALGRDPIPDLTELLEQQGIKVFLLELPDRVSGLTCFVERPGSNAVDVPVIVVNCRHTLERRRLTMAHELAHRLIQEEGTGINLEKAANRFAGAFLQPSDHVRREVGRHRNGFGVPEVLHAKRIYRVSAAAMVVRFRDLGIISQDTMAYIFQTVGRRWRTIEPMPLETPDAAGILEQPRRYERLCFRALAEGFIDLAKAADLLSQSANAVQRAMRGADPL